MRAPSNRLRYIRHPGYLGWFVWAVAGQLLLANPVCAVAFAYVVSGGGCCG